MDTAGSHTWDDVLAGVQTLAELIQTCQDAFGEDEAAPKVCSAFLWGCMLFCRSNTAVSQGTCLLFAGICHHQEAPYSQGHAGAARGLSAYTGTFVVERVTDQTHFCACIIESH